MLVICAVLFQGIGTVSADAEMSKGRLIITVNDEEVADMTDVVCETENGDVALFAEAGEENTDEKEEENEAFKVTAVTPDENAGISPDVQFAIEFSNDIDESTVEDNAVLRDSVNNQDIEFAYEVSGSKLTIKPKYKITQGMHLNLKLKTGIKAYGIENGNLAAEKNYYFAAEDYPIAYRGAAVSENKMLVGLKNVSEEEKTVYCLIALYKDGIEKEISYRKLSFEAYQTKYASFKVQSDLEQCAAEIYVWDLLNGEIITPVMLPKNEDTARTENGEQPKYGDISAQYDFNAEMFTVEGIHDTKRAGIPMTIRIFKKGDEQTLENLVRAETVATGENGKINYSFKLDETAGKGLYTVLINDSFFEKCIKKEVSYVDAEDVEAALAKIDSADESNMAGIFEEVRPILGAADEEFDSLENKKFIYNCILLGKPYSEKGADSFKEIYRRALNICCLLEGEPEKAVEEIKNNHADEYWNIDENVMYTVFDEKLDSAQQANVINKMKNAEKFGDLKDIFEFAVVCEDIKAQSSYNTVYDALSKYNEFTGIDYTVYDKLKENSKLKVCTNFYNAANGFESLADLKKTFENLADAEKNNEKNSENKGGSSGGGGGGGGKSSGGTSAVVKTGVTNAILPGLYQTDKPAPDWYKEDTKETEYTSPFTDTDEVEWAKEAINSLYGMGAISGKSETEFAPNDIITKEELCKIVSVAFGLESGAEDTVQNFDDVAETAWYNEYIMRCNRNKIINGIGNNLFGVGTAVTREEISVILVRAAEAAGKALDYDITIFPFEDEEDISVWAKDSVAVLRECLIIDGVGNGFFAPRENVTRAQAAKMISGVLNFSY